MLVFIQHRVLMQMMIHYQQRGIATKNPRRNGGDFFFYAPMQLVAPRAVTIAVAILAIICTMNLMVSLFVMVFIF